MQLKLLAALFFIASIFAFADDEKYQSAMKKNLEKIDKAETVEDFFNAGNAFERIALAEKDKWLPYYYASMSYTIASFQDSSKEKKDLYLDKAEKFISIADSLEPENSEIYAMKGMAAQARMSVDPMNRWMKYGNLASENFKKSAKIDSTNPRPDYLVGVGVFYTPEQFGGGAKAAKPILENAMAKYEKFEPKNDLMPIWGREMVEELLKKIEEKESSR